MTSIWARSGLPSQPKKASSEPQREDESEGLSKLSDTLARQVKRPKSPPDAKPTQTNLTLDTAIVFRGDRVGARGQVIVLDGRRLPSGVVQILLMDPESGEAIRQLATANLDARGTYRTVVSFPRDLSTGNYEIIAEYMGGQGLASSTSD